MSKRRAGRARHDPQSQPGANDDARLTIRSPGELADSIPYLLGFRPLASLVVVGLQGRHVAVTARVDLYELGRPGFLQELMVVLANSGSESVVAAVYPEFDDHVDLGADGAGVFDLEDLPANSPYGSGQGWDELLERLHESCDAFDLQLVEVLVVHQDRYWSLFCLDPDCCPPEGHKLAGPSSVAAAAATYAGMVALPRREDVAGVLAPDSADERAALLPFIESAENEMVAAALDESTPRYQRRWRRRLRAAADPDPVEEGSTIESLSPADVAGLVVALTDNAVRDALWLDVDEEQLAAADALWLQLARRAPEPYDAAPAFLFGWSQWRQGNGTLARFALERALASDPAYSAARLLSTALDHGLDPRQMPRLNDEDRAPSPSPSSPLSASNVSRPRSAARLRQPHRRAG